MRTRGYCVAGFSLLEVLVAILLLSVALLGLARLQTYSMQTTNSAYFRSQATALANDMIERVRLNPEGNYSSVGVDNLLDCGVIDLCTTACDADDLAVRDLYTVQCGLAGDGGVHYLLPSGAMSVRKKIDSYEVTIQWHESDQVENRVGARGDHRLKMEFVP